MFHITWDYQYENISDWCVSQIGFRLFSDWFQIITKNFRLRLQILGCLILIQIHFRLVVWKIFRLKILKKNHFRLYSGKIVKTSYFVFTFQISLDSRELAVRKCCRWHCLIRGGKFCCHHSRQVGVGAAMYQLVDTDESYDGGVQNCQEGIEGGRRRSQGQSCRHQSHRLPLVIVRSMYRQV